MLPLILHSSFPSLVDTVEISLNAVGKASKLKLNKIKVKRKEKFQKVISFVRNQLEKGQALQSNQSLVWTQELLLSHLVPVHKFIIFPISE
jgi:ElaB/YqjD/DUF883 family membrane-anchored ribosome-binding protein